MARRGRGVGLSAFQNSSTLSNQYASHGNALRTSNLDSLQTQLSVFQSLLHTFALQHSDTIKQNPTFRAEFARMCNAIGVDPLAGSNVAAKKKGKGGWWSQVLGGDVGDFYYAVAVRTVEVCRASRGENGGLLGLQECREMVSKGRGLGGALEVSEYVVMNPGQGWRMKI
jgi:ESCRT-II complex subunit VPS22